MGGTLGFPCENYKKMIGKPMKNIGKHTKTIRSLKRYRGSGGYSQRPADAFCGDVVAKGTCPSHHTVVAATAAVAAA